MKLKKEILNVEEEEKIEGKGVRRNRVGPRIINLASKGTCFSSLRSLSK